MFCITGITGKVGGQVANHLLGHGLPVRAVLRDPAKGAPWRERGCDIAIAEMADAARLQRAFDAAEAVFVLLPPVFDPAPGFPEARACVAALAQALRSARPARVVALSTIGAQATRASLLTQLTLLEQALADLPMPVALLRAAWFIENSAWDLADARRLGVMHSFLQPLDRPVPMVATADVAATAARLLREDWTGLRKIELEGPRRVTPLALAQALGAAVGREVTAQAVPRATWESSFIAQGMKHPGPRMRMLEGFNEGWIEFEGAGTEHVVGPTALEQVLATL